MMAAMRTKILALGVSLVVGVLSPMVAGVTTARPAGADTPGESEQSSQLVREAIALMVNTPGNMAGIEDKIVDALSAPKQAGVDLAVVRQAESAFKQGDMHLVRSLLERSIGAQPHRGTSEPLPIRRTRGSPGATFATGAATGIDVVTDPLSPDRNRSGADVLGLVLLALLAAGGTWLALRLRPPAATTHGTRANKEVGA